MHSATCEHLLVEPDDDYWEPPVDGSVVRLMWDETAGPLWGDEGLLPGEPEWLGGALGLSESLVAALPDWMSDMTACHFSHADEQGQARQHQLDEQGDQLATRVQAEVGGRYRVRFHR